MKWNSSLLSFWSQNLIFLYSKSVRTVAFQTLIYLKIACEVYSKFCHICVLWCIFNISLCMFIILWCIFNISLCMFIILWCIFNISLCMFIILWCIFGSIILWCMYDIVWCMFSIYNHISITRFFNKSLQFMEHTAHMIWNIQVHHKI